MKKIHNRTTRNLLNRVVREQVYGGVECLDACELFGKIQARQQPGSEAFDIAKRARETLEDIANHMRESCREEAARIRAEKKAEKAAHAKDD